MYRIDRLFEYIGRFSLYCVFNTCLANDPIIHAGRHAIDDPIERCEHSEADQRGGYKEADICKAEQQEHLTDHREGEGQVQTREGQRQHKHHEQLGTNAPLDFRLGHAHLLHDFEALHVLVALGDLLVIDNQHGGQQEHDAQHDAYEEQATVPALLFCVLEVVFEAKVLAAFPTFPP